MILRDIWVTDFTFAYQIIIEFYFLAFKNKMLRDEK